VIRARLFRSVRPICLVAAVLAFGLPATTATAGQTTAKKAPAAAAKKPTAAAKKPAAPKKKTVTTAKKPAYSAKSAAARRAQLAKARAAAAAKALREAQTPQFKFDESGALVPDIRAAAAIIYNPVNGKVLWESHSQDQRSIASITKVMTAVVFLEESPDLSAPVVVQRADTLGASTTYLRAGDKVTKEDLLHLMLIASDNAAARVIARTSSRGPAGFIARMDEKAKELGLTSTKYADPSGLLSANVSSAYDMAKLITYVSGDARIAHIMQKQEYVATAGRRKITIHSTNRLVREGDVQVQAGKTGFISKAGYCLATLLRLPQGGPEVAVVVLGAKSSAGRFWETRHLFNWLSSKAQDLIGGTPVEAAAATN
jgi:D-alanyl-D-alanine endopeptidase (penicillin-binding protein 7)